MVELFEGFPKCDKTIPFKFDVQKPLETTLPAYDDILRQIRESEAQLIEQQEAYLRSLFPDEETLRKYIHLIVMETFPLVFEEFDDIMSNDMVFRYTQSYRFRWKTPEELEQERLLKGNPT